ncbi:MAG: tetratricopeptide repeat protein [Candidatus Tectomicrobia bacterium]|uniref:Tetratricopeptide repeat protein n=1 Tax=Tectimicrobiota bacterium TaxID=2528274 RepID=A0A932HZD6_UNCTE|nr:tetratricopeptide repeat protein [Candidatus Tectomicrobia bacterium]
MMGLYGTLGLVGLLAGACLAALWLYHRRAGRRGSFPADAWEPYLQKGGQPTPWGTGVPEEVERVAGGDEAPQEPERQYVASSRASDGSIPSRMKALEAIPISAGEERRREEQKRQMEAASVPKPLRPPDEAEGGEEALDLISSAPAGPPRAPGPPPAPPASISPGPREAPASHGGASSGNGGRRPWWENLPAPKEAPFRLTVAQLMGLAVTDAAAPSSPAAPADPAALPWRPHISVSPEERPPLVSEALAPAPPARDEEPAREEGEEGDFLGLGAGEAPAYSGFDEAAAALPGEPASAAPGPPREPESAPPGAGEAAPEEVSLFDEEAAASEAPAPDLFLKEEETAPFPAEEEEEPDAPPAASRAVPPAAPIGDAPVFAEEPGETAGEGSAAGGEGAAGEEALFLMDEEAIEEAPAAPREAGEARRAPEEADLPALPSEEEEPDVIEEARAPGEEEGAILLEELEEEPPAAAAPAPSAPAETETGERPPDLPSEEEGGADVFAVLRSERGLPEEDVSEEPIGNALLYEENEALENISKQGEVAPSPGRPGEPPAPPPPPLPEAPALPAAESPSAMPDEDDLPREEEEAPVPAASPADLVRKLAADHCPGDLLFAEEGEVRLPAWAQGVTQAALTDLQERQAGKAAVQPEEYIRLGIVEHLLGRHDEASSHFKEALRRARRLGPVLNALAVATFARGKVDPAISYCKEAVREAGGDASLRAAAFRNLGYFYQVKGDHARAAEATASAIEALGTKGDPAQLSRLHLRAGQLLRRLGDAGRAREHLAESASHFRKSGEHAEWARALVALASVQTQLGDADAALKNLEEASRACREMGDAAGEALVLGQMGGTYTALDQFTRALSYYEKAVAIHRELGNRKGEAAHLSNIGNIHYFRGDLEEAEEAYERALRINREEDHLVGQATSLGNLGRLHLEQGALDKARLRLTEARDLFKEAGSEEQLEKVRAMLEEVDRAQGL